VASSASAPSSPRLSPILAVAQMQPRQTLLREYVPCRLKFRSLVKCADMEVRFSPASARFRRSTLTHTGRKIRAAFQATN
jgi:hypothetical protein